MFILSWLNIYFCQSPPKTNWIKIGPWPQISNLRTSTSIGELKGRKKPFSVGRTSVNSCLAQISKSIFLTITNRSFLSRKYLTLKSDSGSPQSWTSPRQETLHLHHSISSAFVTKLCFDGIRFIPLGLVASIAMTAGHLSANALCFIL